MSILAGAIAGLFASTILFTTSAQADLLGDTLEIVKDNGFSATQVGIILAPARGTGASVSHNQHQTFVPASTVKIATAIVADARLGAQTRFATEVLFDGELSAGNLNGDLYLRGAGDPRLEPEHLLDLAMAVRRRGFEEITGALKIDDGAFPTATVVNADQPDDAYNAGIGALAVGFNRVTVHWDNGSAFTVPPLNEASIDIKRRSGGGVVIDRRSGNEKPYRWRIEAAKSSGKEALPVADAGLHAGHIFAHFLAMQGIRIDSIDRATVPETAILIDRHQGPELRSVLRDMLHYSNNQIAEMIGFAAVSDLMDGNWPGGIEAAAQATTGELQRLLPATDWSGLLMRNHSGLDPHGRMTPTQLVDLLRYGFDVVDLPTLLPASAYSGTLARRLVDEEAALGVWAKTGTVFYGSAIAGYLFSSDVEPRAFVIMVADPKRRENFDADPSKQLELAPQAAQWAKRARSMQDALISHWLKNGS